MAEQNGYVAFDYMAVQPTSFSPFHGGGKYGKIVLQELLERTENVILFYSKKLFHGELKAILSEHPSVVLANLDDALLWDDIFVKYDIKTLYLPIPFSKLYKKFITKFPPQVRIVGTIHGLRNTEAIPSMESLLYGKTLKDRVRIMREFLRCRFPGYMTKAQNQWRKLINLRNYEYFVVSDYTKSAIKKFMPEQNPMVFYSPSVVFNDAEIQEKKDSYFLLVSGNRWEKNNLKAMKVLDKMMSEKKIPSHFFVVITGVKDLSCFHFGFKNPDRFRCVGYVEEGKFAEYYAKAYAFIYPSLSEGFGYPILESLAVGTPVIASNLTSIPEVGGAAADYFNPYDAEDIENKIRLILDKTHYDALCAKSHNQYESVLKRQREDLKKCVDFIMKQTW